LTGSTSASHLLTACCCFRPPHEHLPFPELRHRPPRLHALSPHPPRTAYAPTMARAVPAGTCFDSIDNDNRIMGATAGCDRIARDPLGEEVRQGYVMIA
jgi:hypothetical protein